MKQVVEIGEPQPEPAHQAAAVLVAALAGFRQPDISGLPEPGRKGEGRETVRW